MLVLGLAGCLSPTPAGSEPGDGGDPWAGEEGVPLGLVASAPLAVSPVGHRMSEFMVAVDPTDPDRAVVGALDYDHEQGPPGCATYWTHDAGTTWTAGASAPRLNAQRLALDPWVSLDRAGTAHLLCMENGESILHHPNALLVHAASADNGSTWSDPVYVPGRTPRHTVDKPALHVSRNGDVVVCVVNADWDDAQQTGDVNLVFIRSGDAGRTWDSPMPVKAGLLVCNGVLEEESGTLHLNYFSIGETAYPTGIATSTDGGRTWRDTPIAMVPLPPDFAPAGRFVAAYPYFSAPSAALSPATRALLVGAQAWSAAGERWELWLHRSVDGGATFERIAGPPTGSPGCPSCHAAHPTLAYDGSGRLGLEYMLAESGGLTKEVWFAASSDDGGTWSPPVRLHRTEADASFASPRTWLPNPNQASQAALHLAGDPAEALPVANGMLFGEVTASVHHRWGGDYWGIAGLEAGFLALWIAHDGQGVPRLWSSRVHVEPLALV